MGAGWGQAARVPVRGGGGSLPLAAGATPGTMQEALLGMAAGAAVIFTGRVEAVTRQDALGYVDVQFRIEKTVRGCGGATVYVLREWAGLWGGGAGGGVERYRVGQERLMLLTARGKSGMSAPVGGLDGAIPLVAMGKEPLVNGAGVAPADEGGGTGELGVDLRWVGARVMRGTSAGARGGARAALAVTGGPETPTGTDSAGDGSWSGPVSAMTSVRNMDGGAWDAPVKLGYVLTLLAGVAGGGGAR